MIEQWLIYNRNLLLVKEKTVNIFKWAWKTAKCHAEIKSNVNESWAKQ